MPRKAAKRWTGAARSRSPPRRPLATKRGMHYQPNGVACIRSQSAEKTRLGMKVGKARLPLCLASPVQFENRLHAGPTPIKSRVPLGHGNRQEATQLGRITEVGRQSDKITITAVFHIQSDWPGRQGTGNQVPRVGKADVRNPDTDQTRLARCRIEPPGVRDRLVPARKCMADQDSPKNELSAPPRVADPRQTMLAVHTQFRDQNFAVMVPCISDEHFHIQSLHGAFRSRYFR